VLLRERKANVAACTLRTINLPSLECRAKAMGELTPGEWIACSQAVKQLEVGQRAELRERIGAIRGYIELDGDGHLCGLNRFGIGKRAPRRTAQVAFGSSRCSQKQDDRIGRATITQWEIFLETGGAMQCVSFRPTRCRLGECSLTFVTEQ
jgi:hypothetical protein